MIQLSDTKAAPGLGGLLGIKPKAGGDSSAFALALGGLVADAGLDMPIALTRQSIAASGKGLPQDGADDAEGEGKLDWDIQSIALPDVIVLPVEPLVVPSPDAPASITISTGLGEGKAESGETKEQSSDSIVDPSEAVTTAPANPRAEPGAKIDITPKPTDASPPVAEAAKPRSQAVGVEAGPSAPAPIMRAQTARIGSGGENHSAPVIDRAASAPTDPISLISSPQRAASSPDKAIPPPSRPAMADAATIASPAATAVSTTETPPPARGDAAPIGRGAVSARFEPAAVVAKSPNIAAAKKAGVERTPPSAVSSAVAVVLKPEAVPAMPAKFVIADRPIDAPTPAVPRRISITPVVAPAASTAATAMTAADLIPAALRPRAAAVPVVTVTDPASVGLSAPAATASSVAEPAPIDTHAAEWIEGMIEQIEVMRDARADGASATTRIRLSPDALGAVEIMLVGEGEAIEVRINADTAAARTLLAEAAPRLTDMAEARGLRLAQGDAGHPGQHQAQRQQQQDQPTANRRRHDAADPRGPTDERIA